MATVLMNEIELKLTYNYIEQPVTNIDHSNNISFKLGSSTNSDNKFDKELNKLVRKGILTKVYDFVDGGFREGLYNFADGTAQISFFGNNHMNYNLSYNY
ncbi:hypothetical protein AB0Y20_01310 [Heyndrickxia oleronia]|uniref:hypothetical protein n=1 Tax=Heyndrickxia oleronia TaxID=38875 RepID=UPI003F1EB6E1